jgi:hypothetical protein
MTPNQYTSHLKKYVDSRFKTQKEACESFGCSPSSLSLALSGDRSPSNAMLKATGHYMKMTTKTQYLREL